MAEFLSSVSPRVLSRIKLGLRAFEWLPFPWRFSRLDREAAEDFLQRMERSRFFLYHDLLLMGKILATLGYAVTPEVERRVGFEIACGLADGSLPEPAGSLGETAPLGEGEECDVVVIGSGAGGATAAATLAESGLEVLVLEAGEHFNRDSYPSDHLEAIARIYRDGGLTIAEGQPPIPVPVAKVVGGTTVINSGTCFRAPDAVLDDWRQRFGIAWSGELSEDFAEAEDFLRVTPLNPERCQAGHARQLPTAGCRRRRPSPHRGRGGPCPGRGRQSHRRRLHGRRQRPSRPQVRRSGTKGGHRGGRRDRHAGAAPSLRAQRTSRRT